MVDALLLQREQANTAATQSIFADVEVSSGLAAAAIVEEGRWRCRSRQSRTWPTSRRCAQPLAAACFVFAALTGSGRVQWLIREGASFDKIEWPSYNTVRRLPRSKRSDNVWEMLWLMRARGLARR